MDSDTARDLPEGSTIQAPSGRIWTVTGKTRMSTTWAQWERVISSPWPNETFSGTQTDMLNAGTAKTFALVHRAEPEPPQGDPGPDVVTLPDPRDRPYLLGGHDQTAVVTHDGATFANRDQRMLSLVVNREALLEQMEIQGEHDEISLSWRVVTA